MEREIHLLRLSICNDRHSTPPWKKTTGRLSWADYLDTRAVGALPKKTKEKEEVVGRLTGQLTRSWRRLLLNCCGRWHARSVSAPHHRYMWLDSLCHSLSPSLAVRSPSSAFGKIKTPGLVIGLENAGWTSVTDRPRFDQSVTFIRGTKFRESTAVDFRIHHRAPAKTTLTNLRSSFTLMTHVPREC